MSSNPDSHEREIERGTEILASSSRCATLDELATLADASVVAPSRPRVAAHVAACARCTAELALLREFESASPLPEEEEAVEWIVARLRGRFPETLVAAVKAGNAARAPRGHR